MRWVVAESLLEARNATARCRGGARTAEDHAPFDLPQCPRAGCARERGGSSPRTSNRVSGGGGRPAAARCERRRVRRKEHSVSEPPASSPTNRSAGPSGLSARGRRSAGAETAADRRDPRCGATAWCTSTASSRRAAWRHSLPRGRRRTRARSSRCVERGRRGGSPGRHRRWRGKPDSPSSRCWSKVRLDAAGVDRASLTDDPTLLDVCVRAPSGASAGAPSWPTTSAGLEPSNSR